MVGGGVGKKFYQNKVIKTNPDCHNQWGSWLEHWVHEKNMASFQLWEIGIHKLWSS